MRRIALIVAAIVTGSLAGVQPALAGVVSTCAPSGQAALIGLHAFAQPFDLAQDSDVTTIHVWLGGTGGALAHLSVQPLVPRVAGDPTSPLVPASTPPLLALDSTPTSPTPSDAAIPVHLGHLAAGSYALIVEPVGDLALGGCVGPPFALYQSDGRWRAVPVDAGFALVLDGGPADRQPPAVAFDQLPPSPTNATALAIAFHADEPASFTCTWDAGAPAPCGSPFVAEPLAEGQHALAIDAVDAWGNATVTPAIATFLVDRTAPTTTASVDLPRGGARQALLHLGSSEAPVTFACSLDGAPPAACASGDAIALAAEGVHAIHVVATDAAGNADPTGADATFVADWTAPTIGPLADVSATATSASGVVVSYVVAASDAIDPAPAVACLPASGTPFVVGDTPVTCTAQDASGNGSTATFTVHVAPPPITSAEIDVAFDPATGEIAFSEPDGGTIAPGARGSLVATIDGHHTRVRVDGDDDHRDPLRHLTLRALAYDGAAAQRPGRNGYDVHVQRDASGAIVVVRIRTRVGLDRVSVRYDASTNTSTVWRGRPGSLGAPTRVTGLVVPHLRSDHGALRIVIAAPAQA